MEIEGRNITQKQGDFTVIIISTLDYFGPMNALELFNKVNKWIDSKSFLQILTMLYGTKEIITLNNNIISLNKEYYKDLETEYYYGEELDCE